MVQENLNKERHGCVSAWLIFMLIVNALTALLYLLGGDFVMENSAVEISKEMILILGLFSIFNVVCAIMLLKWKKWAFWGFGISAVAAAIINYALGLGIATSLFGVIGIVVLYAILQIRRNNVSAWDNME